MGEEILGIGMIISLTLLVSGFIRMHATSDHLCGTKTMAASLVLGMACVFGIAFVPQEAVSALTAQECARDGGQFEVLGRIEGPDTAVCLMPNGVIKEAISPVSG